MRDRHQQWSRGDAFITAGPAQLNLNALCPARACTALAAAGSSKDGQGSKCRSAAAGRGARPFIRRSALMSSAACPPPASSRLELCSPLCRLSLCPPNAFPWPQACHVPPAPLDCLVNVQQLPVAEASRRGPAGALLARQHDQRSCRGAHVAEQDMASEEPAAARSSCAHTLPGRLSEGGAGRCAGRAGRDSTASQSVVPSTACALTRRAGACKRCVGFGCALSSSAARQKKQIVPGPCTAHAGEALAAQPLAAAPPATAAHSLLDRCTQCRPGLACPSAILRSALARVGKNTSKSASRACDAPAGRGRSRGAHLAGRQSSG